MKRQLCIRKRFADICGGDGGKRLRRTVGAGVLFLLFGAGALSVSAEVTEGKPGQTLSGDYAVIVNTSTDETQSTGTLIFDTSGNGTNTVRTSSAKDPVGQDVQAGVSYSPARISAGVAYDVGAEKEIVSPYNGPRTYICIGASESCYIWMESGLKSSYDAQNKTEKIARDMTQTYEGQPYKMLKEMAGGTLPWNKLSIMLESISNASGVYKYNAELTAIHINTPAAASYEYGSMGSRNGLLVHEGQHALFRLMAQNDPYQFYTWLNEGISVAAMDWLWGGTDNNGWMDSIAGNTEIRNGTPLIYGTYRNSTAQDYGMPYLFVRYLAAQAAGASGSYDPMKLIPNFYQVSANCSPDIYLERVLAQMGHSVSFGDLLTQFYTAIIAQESSGVYGFAGDSIVRQKVNSYPLYMGESGQAHSLAPTAAIMVKLENGVFTVPSNGGSNIRYMIVSGGRNVPVPEGGDGSSENPYVIDEFSDLALIGNRPGAHYKLTKDVEAGGQKNLTVVYFSGVLDGDGHAIHGLSAPLIGRNAGTVQNLTIEAAFNGDFTGTQGMFAQVNSGLIKDCTATGTISGTILRGQSSLSYAAFGVFVGENEVAGRIFRCDAKATVQLTAPAGKCWIGGITGVQIGTVKNCSSRGSIAVTPSDDSELYVGGIAGKLESMGAMGGLLSCCIHTGDIQVTGEGAAVGQICGQADRSIINTGLGNHIVNCRTKKNGIPAVGATNAKDVEIPETVDQEVLRTDDELKQQDSYEGWNFGSDWQMGANGPEHITGDDITDLGTVNTPVSCYVGETFYDNWGNVTVNGQIGAVITDDMVSGFDSSTPGKRIVKLTYCGKSVSFEIEVKAPKKVSGLAISSVGKSKYNIGEYFDPTGVCLIATIDGTSHAIHSGFDYNRKSPLTEDTDVTFTYYGASVTYARITVVGKKPISLTVASNPVKTRYAEGQNLDLSGLQVSLTYNNGEVTPKISAKEFDSYGIHVVKKTGNAYTEIQPDQTLTATDNGAVIYVCATELMPNSAGTVSKSVATLTVLPLLRVESPVIHVVRGIKITSTLSVNVSGGSGNYTVQTVSEKLPDGITIQWWRTSFLYDGTATAPVGSYVSKYYVTDTETGQKIAVEITVQVHPSNYAELHLFNIPAEWNKDTGLTRDVIGMIDNVGRTVVLRIPEGTDVSALKINVDYGAGIGVSVPAGCGSMSVFDFRSPVNYELIASDGTKIEYTVTVEFYDPENEPSGGSGGSGGTGGIEPGSGGGTGTGGQPSGGGTGGSGGAGVGAGTGGGKPTGSGGIGASGAGTGSSKIQDSFSSEQANTSSDPKVGTLIKYGGAYYRITGGGRVGYTAELCRPVKKKIKTLKVAATVKANGRTYKVTAIAARAFKGNRYLKKVTIGKYVQVIGAKAFYGCKNLRQITVKGTALKKVKNGAVKGIHPKAVIRVPKKKRAAYGKLFKRKVS